LLKQLIQFFLSSLLGVLCFCLSGRELGKDQQQQPQLEQ
jgi:hypothetical protein